MSAPITRPPARTLHLQGLEIKQLEGERKWIGQEKARDVSAFNAREIAGINHRYDRRQS